MVLLQRNVQDRFAFLICLLLLHICSLLKHHRVWDNNGDDNGEMVRDYHFMCRTWAEEGRCDEYNDDDDNYSIYDVCPKSCLIMTTVNNFLSDAIQGNVKCLTESSLLHQDCSNGQYHFGVPQHVDVSDPMIVEILNVIHKSSVHIVETVLDNNDEEEPSFQCRNKYEDCSYRAAMGMCQSSSTIVVDYDMELDCAPACQSCPSLQRIMKCDDYMHQEGNVNVWQPGDLNRMFQRLINTNQDNIKVISHPNLKHNHNLERLSPLSTKNKQQTSTGQWLLAYPNFLTEKETNAIISLGETLHFHPSTISSPDEIDNNDDTGENIKIEEWRTSDSTWCDHSCLKESIIDNEIMKSVVNRIVNMTGIEAKHIEPIQILRYQTGQFYVEHHDFIQNERHLPGGPRILTVFLYLNDVTKGGETQFTRNDKHNITITPKRGTMLIWPNVLDLDPSIADDRMYHEALIVEEGIKYAANIWFHLRNYEMAHAKNCT